MLKKYINEMGSIREKGSIILPTKQALKIAAPKPVRARPMALNHLGNSKWFQSSPVKNENAAEDSTELGLDTRECGVNLFVKTDN